MRGSSITRRSTPSPFIAGFAEGFFSPVLELVFGILIGAALTVGEEASSATGTLNPLPNFTLIFTVVSVIDIIRNIGSSLAHSSLAMGNVVGNIFGLFIFYGAISAVSQESATSSVFWTAIMAISLVAGIILTVWKRSQEKRVYDYF